MAASIKFRMVRAAGAVLRHLHRVVDPRRHPLPGQTDVMPAREVRMDLTHHRHHGKRDFVPPFTTVRMDAAFTLELRNAEVVGSGIVMDAAGRVVLESALFQRDYLRRHHQDHMIVGRRWLKRSTHDRAIPLLNILDRNYFHWITESLPRLLLVRDRVLAEDWPVLLNANPPPFVTESLAWFFGTSLRIITDGTSCRHVRHLLLPSFAHTRRADTGWLNVYDPEVLRRLNRMSLEQVDVSGPPVALLISRADGRERQLVNEEVIPERFPGLNWQVVRLGEMSFREQVRLFARASVVVGAHGAGLTNLLFARSPLIIELYPAARPMRDLPYFLQISAALGFRHHTVECPAVNADQDMHVDNFVLDTMEGILRRAGLPC